MFAIVVMVIVAAGSAAIAVVATVVIATVVVTMVIATVIAAAVMPELIAAARHGQTRPAAAIPGERGRTVDAPDAQLVGHGGKSHGGRSAEKREGNASAYRLCHGVSS